MVHGVAGFLFQIFVTDVVVHVPVLYCNRKSVQYGKLVTKWLYILQLTSGEVEVCG